MGTNYYLLKDPCSKCGHAEDRLHIGKSSAGWCFSLHVTNDSGEHEELGIPLVGQARTPLQQWKDLFHESGTKIINEYGEEKSVAEMLTVICARTWDRDPESSFDYTANRAEAGPQGLVRSRVDGRHCLGHGYGTYDYINGEFS